MQSPVSEVGDDIWNADGDNFEKEMWERSLTKLKNSFGNVSKYDELECQERLPTNYSIEIQAGYKEGISESKDNHLQHVILLFFFKIFPTEEKF